MSIFGKIKDAIFGHKPAATAAPLKLLGIDSSLDNRKELASELGYTGALDGSAEMNIWLHKATNAQTCGQRWQGAGQHGRLNLTCLSLP